MKNLIKQLKSEGYYQFMLNFRILKIITTAWLCIIQKNRQKLKPDLFSTKTFINFSGYEAGNEMLVEFHKTRNHHLYTYRYIKINGNL